VSLSFASSFSRAFSRRFDLRLACFFAGSLLRFFFNLSFCFESSFFLAIFFLSNFAAALTRAIFFLNACPLIL